MLRRKMVNMALAVTEDGRREVLGIFNKPTEISTGWGDIFDKLKGRGVERVGLMVADGITGLDSVIVEKFPGTPLQRCVTHLKRNMFAKVRHGDKAALAADMRDVFRTGQRDYTVEEAWDKWQEMCDKWGKDYRSIKLLRNNADYKAYLTYLNYAPEIQSMIYTTNWIERLNYTSVSSSGAALLLAGCSSAEPVSSSGCDAKLQKKRQIMIQCQIYN